MSIKLRELIRSVRSCKTAADERSTIQKECALIRTSFKEFSNDSSLRHRNVAKLLYIQMLGYPTHFGQMECIKLIASPNYPEKRIGYLGLMILLDESQEVLMLVTNSLKNDLSHSNQYVVGLALASLGNLASTDMARDLASEVDKLFKSSNVYIRKKAALCAVRIVRKVPETMDTFCNSYSYLLEEKHHGALLAGVTFLVEACKVVPDTKRQLKKHFPQLIRILKSLVLSGYSHDYEIAGISDPFLQVKILQLLRVLAQDNENFIEDISDILANVATNTDSSKNPGNAILYEVTQTILSLDCDSSLRLVAINILGRFLANRENNIRYVALNTLCKLVTHDAQAIQRYRNTIVDCLKDADISIRKRSLELLYCLINTSNIASLLVELLAYLSLSPLTDSFSVDLAQKIAKLIDSFGPNSMWKIQSYMQLVSKAGGILPESSLASFIYLIQVGPNQAYATHSLVRSVKTNYNKGLVMAAVWCIGEYGEMLIKESGVRDASKEGLNAELYSEEEILQLLDSLAKHYDSTPEIKLYILAALGKLIGRFSNSDSIEDQLNNYSGSIAVEVQQRSLEYTKLISTSSNVRKTVTAPLPILQVRNKMDDDEDEVSHHVHEDLLSSSPRSHINEEAVPVKLVAQTDNLLDDLFGFGNSTSNSVKSNNSQSIHPQNNKNNSDDLLNSLFGSSDITSSSKSYSNANILDDMFAPSTHQIQAAVVVSPPLVNNVNAFNRNGVSVEFQVEKNNNLSKIVAVMTNKSMIEVTNFELKVAVPKYLILTLNPASGTSIASNGGSLFQKLDISNSMHGQKPVQVKLKIDYKHGGQAVSEQVQSVL